MKKRKIPRPTENDDKRWAKFETKTGFIERATKERSNTHHFIASKDEGKGGVW